MAIELQVVTLSSYDFGVFLDDTFGAARNILVVNFCLRKTRYTAINELSEPSCFSIDCRRSSVSVLLTSTIIDLLCLLFLMFKFSRFFCERTEKVDEICSWVIGDKCCVQWRITDDDSSCR